MSTNVPTGQSLVKRPLILLPPEETRRRLGGISRSQEYRLLKYDPKFPRPITGAGLRRAYVESEVEAYLAQRLDERDRRLELPLGTA
jgi:predicted DNA-binding transcriptional regulator AlpA